MPFKEQKSKDMEVFANGGLSTLCIAYIMLDEYLTWSRDAATNAIENRDAVDVVALDLGRASGLSPTLKDHFSVQLT